MSAPLPTISVLMGAYNYAQYVGRAIESAVHQDYPPELLEVIVVNDGSTDETEAVVRGLIERHPGRIRLINQANGGYIAATNRAIAEADGELIALLDADDVWLPQKTIRQVEMLLGDPGLAMVFCDMLVVDGEERPVRPSLMGTMDPLPDRIFPRILYANVATQSSIMIRSALRPRFAPIPAGIPYADWWLALVAAQAGGVDFIPEQLALYREHGANLTGGVSGAATVREAIKEIAFQLWALRHLSLDSLTPDELSFVWSGVEEHARRAVQAAGSFFVTLSARQEGDQAAAAEAARRSAELEAAGDLLGAARSALVAMAWDPYAPGAKQRLDSCVGEARAAEDLPHPLRGARPFVVLVDAEDLLEDEALLRAWADAMAGCRVVTLAIDGTRMDENSVAERLQGLVDRCEVGDRDDVDLLAVIGVQTAPQRHRMLRGAAARIGPGHAGGHDGPSRSYDRTSLGDLRGLIDSGELWDHAASTS